MPISRLLFFPQSTNQSVENSLIITTLINIQFAEETAQDNSLHLPGERFLNLLTFLGCSPNINLTPTENEDHCSISLLEQSPSPRCVGFTQHIHPKCPHCKKRIANWKTPHWQETEQICTCDKCQTETHYENLNWKHECGFARCGFEVTHIYPHEAVPTDQLLNALQSATGFEWQYCYANS